MKRLIILLFITSIISSCGSKTDLAKEEKAIRALLQQERKAHIEKNTALFMSEFADSMISVNKGIVKVPSKAEHEERIGNYFGRVEFVKWDDVVEPVIRFSTDGSLAYAIVQKQVILSSAGSIDTTDYAWVSIYRKQNGEWKVETNVSTNK